MMTKIQVVALLSLFVAAPLAAGETAGRLEANSVETRNRKTVQDALALCKAAGCAPCGTFKYNPLFKSEVLYTKTYCESQYEYRLEEARKAAEDLEIRTKYGN